MKKIKFKSEAREALTKGASILANCVKVTLGPNGKNVVISNINGVPRITKDGVSVAKEVFLKDPFENAGAQLVKGIAAKMGDDAGDGTTTATVLAKALLKEGINKIDDGRNPTLIKRGIDKATAEVVKIIKEKSKEITSDKIKHIATISANNDEEIGSLIHDAINKVGFNGTITMEDSKTPETYIEMVHGTRVKCGYASSYFVNNTDRMTCEFEDVKILVLEEKIKSIHSFLYELENAVQQDKPVLIIAPEIDNEVINTLVVNRIQKGIKICAIKTGYHDPYLIKDLKLIANGGAEKVIISNNETTIINGYGDNDKALELANNTDDINRKMRLTGGICIIKVGANSETEQKEKKDRVEDALCATKAAIEEGVVPGAGVTYLYAMNQLDKLDSKCKDEKIGIALVRKALEEPFIQLCDNAGLDPGALYSKFDTKEFGTGVNILTGEICNLEEKGILDPAKVERLAIETAASVVGLFLTTECVICEYDS